MQALRVVDSSGNPLRLHLFANLVSAPTRFTDRVLRVNMCVAVATQGVTTPSRLLSAISRVYSEPSGFDVT